MSSVAKFKICVTKSFQNCSRENPGIFFYKNKLADILEFFYSNGMLKFMTQIPNYIIIFVIYCNHPTSFQSDIWKGVKM